MSGSHDSRKMCTKQDFAKSALLSSKRRFKKGGTVTFHGSTVSSHHADGARLNSPHNSCSGVSTNHTQFAKHGGREESPPHLLVGNLRPSSSPYIRRRRPRSQPSPRNPRTRLPKERQVPKQCGKVSR